MKNTKSGFIGIIIAILAALIIAGGAGYLYIQHQNKVATQNQIDFGTNNPDDITYSNTGTTTVANSNISTTVKSTTTVQASSTISTTLTDSDVLNATYSLAGVEVTFPPYNNSYIGSGLTNPVCITTAGGYITSGFTSTVNCAEVFWISGYKYTDSSRTEATVNINGGFGAGGIDNRVFNVLKSNGKITAKEITNASSSTTSNISPYITLLSPNGGEVLKTGQSYMIKWNSSEATGTVLIDLLSGGHDRGIINYGENTSVTSGQYSWTVPAPFGVDPGVSETSDKIVIYLNQGNGSTLENDLQDSSNNTFTIQP